MNNIKLETDIIGKKIYHFDNIDSTNIFSKKLIKKDAIQGTVVVSDIQMKGRGRKDRNWFSPKGGLWFSIILYPKLSVNKSILVTMIASISVSQSIIKLTNTKPVIKWPNDILINKKKVCGILTETEVKKGKIEYMIVGIGLNVNNKLNDELSKSATSLIEEINKDISIQDLLKDILVNFDNNYKLLNKKDFLQIRKLWLNFSNIIGRKVKIKEEESEIIGNVIDFSEDGSLIIESENKRKKIIFGDLEYI